MIQTKQEIPRNRPTEAEYLIEKTFGISNFLHIFEFEIFKCLYFEIRLVNELCRDLAKSSKCLFPFSSLCVFFPSFPSECRQIFSWEELASTNWNYPAFIPIASELSFLMLLQLILVFQLLCTEDCFIDHMHI